jgi:formylglycine-generating enzyme
MSSPGPKRPDLKQVETRLCYLLADITGLLRDQVTPNQTVFEIFEHDSMGYVELVMEVEDQFHLLPTSDEEFDGATRDRSLTIAQFARWIWDHIDDKNPPAIDLPPSTAPNLAVIENRVLEIVAEQLGIDIKKLNLDLRLIQDLNCDSLDFVEIFLRMENAFDVHFPDPNLGNDLFKTVFTRNPLRIRDLAEMVYIQWGTGKRRQAPGFFSSRPSPLTGLQEIIPATVPFTQLSGRFAPLAPQTPAFDQGPILNNVPTFRRRTDGMRCHLLAHALVRLGYDGPGAQPDESDLHNAWLDEFLIDAEPVSATAYARFLNSIGHVSDQILHDWFILAPDDKRNSHQILTPSSSGWQPYPGTETFPMILVSWFGAHAYARWANGADWQSYATASPLGFLPTEAQWEYAARGPHPCAYPWGNSPPSPALLQAGLHKPGQTYPTPKDLPMSPVNALQGITSTGLHHMAGNVWQWCADWYDPAFYRSPGAYKNNPVNTVPSGAGFGGRCERGGSWVGPASVARSSYRRARAPHARGRCLGFRCVSAIPASK